MHKDKQPDMIKLFSAISQLSVQRWTALLQLCLHQCKICLRLVVSSELIGPWGAVQPRSVPASLFNNELELG